MQNLFKVCKQIHQCPQGCQALYSPGEVGTSRCPSQQHLLTYDFLHKDITKGQLHAELHSSRAPYGSPCSPTLMQKGQDLIFWKHRFSDFSQYSDSLASIPDINTLSSRSDFHLIHKNRHTLHNSLNCLHAASFSLDKCHQHTLHLRHKHLMEQARLAAETSNVPTDAALNNVLKAETISATFRKLKTYAKGEHRTTL